MHDGQNFGHTDFLETSQPHDMNDLLGDVGDMFGYPISAPVTAPESFWDTSNMALSMDIDFSNPGASLFQYPTTPSHRPSGSFASSHRPSGSFDWNSEVPLFEAPQARPTSSNQENIRPPHRRQRALAPKPPASQQMRGTATSTSMAPTVQPPIFTFPLTGALGEVDPGVLFSRPHTSATNVNYSLNDLETPFAAEPVIGPSSGSLRRSASAKGTRNGKMAEPAPVSSPKKPSPARPGLGRSFSENKGRKTLGQAPVLKQAAGPRSALQARGGGPSMETSRSLNRSSGRISPVKSSHSQSLASIPESASRPVSRASIVFTIDNSGHARAEQYEPSGYVDINRLVKSRSVRGQSFPREEADDSDDEPIILPSRNTSFALPDPRKPVGSFFQSSRRSISNESTSTLTFPDDQNAISNDIESEAESESVNEGLDTKGSAVSELLEIVKNRKRQMPSTRTRTTRSVNQRSLRKNAGLGNTMDGQAIRCVCHNNGADENDGFMIQW